MGVNPKLTVLSEQLRGQLFELTDDRYRLGRSPDLEITITDQTVSGHHCNLERSEEEGIRYIAVDEGHSTNGTRINGRLITRQALVSGDILQLGSVECMFESDSDLPPDTSSTNTDIYIDECAIDPNTKTGNLKPQKWQSNDKAMSKGIQIVIWSLVSIVVGLILWLVIALLSPGAQ